MGGKPRGQAQLANAWREWIATALHGGCTREQLLAELVSEGVPRALAQRELASIVPASRILSETLARASLALTLRSNLRSRHVARGPLCDRESFQRHYLETNTPVLFEDGCSPLGIVGRWTPKSFHERAGHCGLRVSGERESDPDHYVDPENNHQHMKLSELVERSLSETGNDLYLVSRNRALEGDLHFLLDDIESLPDFLDPKQWRDCVSLWMGPAGTHTPMHHDTSHILFCQIYGRKRIQLVASDDPAMLSVPVRHSFYANPPPHAHIYELIIEAGQALYLPLGWWHEVDALEPSISLSFVGFLDGQADDSYRMGSPGAALGHEL